MLWCLGKQQFEVLINIQMLGFGGLNKTVSVTMIRYSWLRIYILEVELLFLK